MMGSTRRVRALSAVVLAGAVLAGGRAGAQGRYGATPVYPSAGLHGPAYGGFGSGGVSGYGYGVTTGAPGVGYRSASSFLRASPPIPPAQTTIALQPLYNAITALPGWYGTSRPGPRTTRVLPRVPREQLLGDDGTILWPGATPDDPAVSASRRAAEGSVKEVVREVRSTGHATVRQVVDAKNKLTAFAREALPEVKARNALDATGLETFIVELGKTLQTMAEHY